MDALVGVGGRAAYVDTFNDLGGYIEIIEMLPVVESLFNMVYQASERTTAAVSRTWLLTTDAALVLALSF